MTTQIHSLRPALIHMFVEMQLRILMQLGSNSLPIFGQHQQVMKSEREYQSILEMFGYNSGQERERLFVETTTWHRDNAGLFDYQAPSENRASFLVESTCQIYRHSASGKVSIFYGEQSPSLEDIYIATVLYNTDNRTFSIQSADVSGVKPHPFIAEEKPDLFRNSYIAINSAWKCQNSEGYPLRFGNFIKLGKVEFSVIQVYNPLGTTTTDSKETSHLEQNKGVHIVREQIKGMCKICLIDQDNPLNPLITPCNCKGSCGVVHVECLRSWTTKKIKKEVNNLVLSYNFSKFQCEICKQLLPRAVRLADNTEIVMLDYEKASRPYIILESSNDRIADKTDRVVHVIFPLQNKSVKLGRGTYCQIRIDDITVSRCHAEISYRNGQFYIKDLKSKFGTLVKFREQLKPKDNLKIQSGRTLLTFSTRPRERTPKKLSKKVQRQTQQQ